MEYAIEADNVHKTFDGKNYVLKGIDLKIVRDSLTVIIGYSGTGKSVFLKHILGLLNPTEGSVKVLGQDLSLLSQDELTLFRRHYGMLFQGSALFDDMSALENVCFPLYEHRKELTSEQIIERAKTQLKLVGLDPKHYNKLPSQISGGMQKRVGLARALVLEPEMLIYDEPTTGLDPILTRMVDNLIVHTHKRVKGLTTIVVSHDLAAAFRIGDYVAMLDSGKVLLYGKPEDFLNSKIELVQKFIEKGIRKQ